MSLRTDVELAPYTTWRIGGPARLFAEPTSAEELGAAAAAAAGRGLPFVVLGRGSNVLVPDEGLDALVACTRSSLTSLRVDVDAGEVVADGGCFLPNLARAVRRAGLSGFEFLAGIPGTVGAAVAINAGIGGLGGPCVRDLLVEVVLLDTTTGSLVTRPAGDLDLVYRGSAVLCRDWIVSARFRATGRDDPAAIEETERRHLRDRAARQPLNLRSTGSVFKPAPDGTAAGALLEEAGMKGHRVGDALVSEKHANWIVNLGSATAADVRAVLDDCVAAVEQRCGVTLEREVVVLPDDLRPV